MKAWMRAAAGVWNRTRQWTVSQYLGFGLLALAADLAVFGYDAAHPPTVSIVVPNRVHAGVSVLFPADRDGTAEIDLDTMTAHPPAIDTEPSALKLAVNVSGDGENDPLCWDEDSASDAPGSDPAVRRAQITSFPVVCGASYRIDARVLCSGAPGAARQLVIRYSNDEFAGASNGQVWGMAAFVSAMAGLQFLAADARDRSRRRRRQAVP